MNMIPNYLNPYPDELLYSWINRLAEANGMPVLDFVRTYLQGEHAAYKYVRADVRSVIPALYDRIPHDDFPDVMSFILNFSILTFASISMPDYLLAQYVNNSFQPYNKLNRTIHGLVRRVNICPECIKEDTDTCGEPYLHRKHQLPGVCVCEKHKTWLYRYDRRYKGGMVEYGRECDYDLNDYTEITEHPTLSDAAAYTAYACSVLDNGIVTNYTNTWRIISECIARRAGSFKDRYEEFIADYEKWEHAGLCALPERDKFFKQTQSPSGLRMDEVMPIAMFLFPDPDDLIAELKKRGSVLNKYTCPVCGYEYCTATGNAWICPRCNRDASDEEIFAMLVDILGDGEYELLSPFISMQKPVKMRHIPCGRIADFSPLRFLYRGTRCNCEKPPEGLRGSKSYRETQDTRWMEKFELYKQYVKETGTLYIPVKMEYHGVKLGEWVQRQRKLNSENRLSAYRKAELLSFEPDFFTPYVLRRRDERQKIKNDCFK